MLETDLYIACIDLSGRRVLVIGDGAMADEKAAGLSASNAEVVRVATAEYDPSVLEGAILVIAVTDDLDLARRIFEDADKRAMLVNVADVPRYCNFILPAIARSGPITVAVSTSGASPALAKRLRSEISDHLGAAYARLAGLLDRIRPWAKEHLGSYDERKEFFDGIVGADPDPIELLRAGRDDEVEELIARAQRQVEG
jgi:precorrin-2 dehydrogenase / sirohydrochlorin ferrochelatase